MTARRVLASLSLLVLCIATFSAARTRRDPLNAKETDELREAAQDPQNRFKLYIKFTQERLVAVEDLRSPVNPPPDRGQRIHDALEDFASLIDEINDNVDSYDHQHQDLRKSLPLLIQADTGWQERLRQFKEGVVKDPELSKDSRDFFFVLDGAVDAVNSLGENARETLQEQIAAKNKKN